MEIDDTYKLGNRTKCIIRSYTKGTLGQEEMEYKNQPYTILKDVDVNFDFINNTLYQNGGQYRDTVLGYNKNKINTITISNVLITSKILNLLYAKNENEDNLCMITENCISDDNKIYLNTNVDTIYDVFIYNNLGSLETHYDSYDLSNGAFIEVENDNSSYLICYYKSGTKSVDLNSGNNNLVNLDFEIQGNKNNETHTMWIHCEKCLPVANKQINFTNKTNTIDITFKVLDGDSGNNFITTEGEE